MKGGDVRKEKWGNCPLPPMAFPGVYRIFCKTSGKSYVGQSRNIQSRVAAHRKTRNASHVIGCPLYDAIKAMGVANFFVEVLERVDDDSARLEREKYWIGMFGSVAPYGYNIASENGWKKSPESVERTAAAHRGSKRSKETCSRISAALSGKTRSEEQRRRQSMSQTGRKRAPHSEETKEKIRQAHLGKQLSEEHRKRIGEGSRGRVMSQQARDKISAAKKGSRWSEEHKRNFSLARKGVKLGPRKKKQETADAS